MDEGNSARNKIVRLDDHIFRLGPLGSPRVLSSYLIVDDKVAVIDCGPSSVKNELIELIKEVGISSDEIDYLLLTHIHIDHAGGTASFLRHFSHARAMIPEKGYKHMLDPAILNASSLAIIGEKIFRHWGACEPVPPHLASSVAPFTKIDLGHSEIQYIPAPGHAPHHHILKLEPLSILFAADSMGIMDNENNALIPTTPPPSFDFEKAIQDITAVEQLAPKLACIAHFQELEPSSSLFGRIKIIYEKWLARTNELVRQKSINGYDLNVCEELFAILVKDFPEYSRISGDLREQAIRIDCAGMLNYSLRRPRV